MTGFTESLLLSDFSAIYKCLFYRWVRDLRSPGKNITKDSAPFKSQLTVFRKPLVVYIIESNIETLRFIDIHQQPEVKG